MTTVALVFPHQLFQNHPVLRESVEKVLLIEESLFFGDDKYPMRFHKQKLAYHRATMAHFAAELRDAEVVVETVAYQAGGTLRATCTALRQAGVSGLVVVDVVDFLLSRRLRSAANEAGLELTWLSTPAFINPSEENSAWRDSRKRWFMADFYQWQRKRLDILLDDGKPAGGQWSFDEDNRKKIPRQLAQSIPELPIIDADEVITDAVASVEQDFSDNPGSLRTWHYPVNHQQAQHWLQVFLRERFERFGPYEDAMLAGQPWLYHAVLTPMLNTGLLTPQHVVDESLRYAERAQIPLNSVEGFVRQIIGWREFMRATYVDLGVTMRTTNHWGHTRAMPASFYTASTGIDPIDDVIGRVLDTGYCHHIERLMILGGFMFLCEIHPDAIYTWFMEMFIDSYDWVMVPNVYAMSQHADGGAITTKPYFSGSNYVLKMSNYRKGEWSVIWDALFWRWVMLHQDELAGNPRWAMMVNNARRMDEAKMAQHLQHANAFLASLDSR